MHTRLEHTLGLVLGVALAATASAQVTVDGSTAGDCYGSVVSVQAVQTGFGDNFSELDAAYAVADSGRLYVALTGNIENNFNKLEVFIDSVPGGENVLSGLPGNDGAGVMAGLTFDAGFEADYHLIARRGFAGTERFDLDIAVLGTANFSSYSDVFGGVWEGTGLTGTGPGNAAPIEVAYDNSNTAGVMGGMGAADQAAALAVTTGFEVSIDLADLGSPGGAIRVLAFVNSSGHDFASNQFLGPLPPPQGNLGSAVFDLGAFAGDQFFRAQSQLGMSACSPALANSTGGPARISAAGTLNDDVTLCATGMPLDESGYFLASDAVRNTPFIPPGSSGNFCLGGGNTLGRYSGQVQNSGTVGMFSLGIDPAAVPWAGGTGQGNPGTIDVTGQTWYFSCWYRDGMTSNFTDVVCISFVPL